MCAGILAGIGGDRLRAQAPPTAASAPDSATKALLDKAQAAEAHGRMDLAVQAWQQVLLGEPKNAAALGGLARAARAMGDPALAESYERQLKAVGGTVTVTPDAAKSASPAMTGAPIASPSATLTAEQKARLAQAAKLSSDGKYAAAMTIYRQVFGSQPPPDWAVAYYETQAATEAGRPQALAGLRALVAKFPQDPRFQVSLGRVLTYDPATRLEGRSYVAKFPQDASAAQALRQSLLWDAANPAAAPEIRTYLAAHRDPQLAAVFQATQPAGKAADALALAPASAAPAAVGATSTASSQPAPPIAHRDATPSVAAPARTVEPRTPAVKSASVPDHGVPQAVRADARAQAAAETAAYQSLNASRIDEAETRFKAILTTDPADEKALAGVGYVRMQQGNFAGAISFLEQAKRIDAEGGSQDKGLSAALDTARFWFIIGAGHDAYAANDLTTAEKRYREALAMRPDSAEALEGLGGTLLKAQQPGPAVPLFEHAVEVQPASAEGWRGLFMAEFRNDQAALALATYKRIPDAPRAQLMIDPLFLQPLASAYAAVGRAEDAQATLEGALKRPLAADQKDLKADIQLELAGILASANHLDEALAIDRQVLAADPGNGVAWQGKVRLEHTLGRDQEALATVEAMPPGIYTSAIRAPGFAITVASIDEALKKLDMALDVLQKAATEETNAGLQPSAAIEMQLAGIYAERGSPQLAYPVYQQVLRENPDRVDAWAGLLSALHVTGHDKEALAQLELIPAGPRAQLQQNPGFLQTMAAVYAGTGRSQEASQALGQVEQKSEAERGAAPAEVEIAKAWALYNGTDDAGLYRALMGLGGRGDLSADQRRTVQTIWTNWAARRAGQATAVGDTRRALEILNAAARAFPDNPAAIKLLAAGYAQAGEPHQAVLIYRTENMASASAADYEGAVSAALSDGDSKDAEIWVRYGMASFPADAQLLILAARFEQTRGDTAKAIRYYKASLKAMPPGLRAKTMPELGLPGPLAPLSLPSVQQPQDISVLLAPGYTEQLLPTEPYLPKNKNGPLPPYDGMTQLVPPYMTNPEGKATEASVGPVSPEVTSTVRDASLRGMGLDTGKGDRGGAQTAAATQTVVANGEVYKPYVAYVVPPATGYRGNPTSAVSVQLGNDTPHPVRAQADVTDVLPTERYGPSARANQAAASRANVAAARAERIRRLQAQPIEARSGQSHPPPEDTITGVMEPAQYTAQAQSPKAPASPPKMLGEIPDTGAQQYPQPALPPASSVTTIAHARPAVHHAAAHAPAAAAQKTTAVRPPVPPRIAPATVPAVIAPAPQQAATVPTATSPPATAVAPPGQVAEGDAPIGPAFPIAAPPTDAELRAHNLPALGGAFNAQAPLPQTPREQAEKELASLENSYSGWVGVTGVARYRSGTLGLDRLYDFEAPVEASAVFWRSLRVTAVAEPVFLNSGTLNPAAFAAGNVPYLGTMAANAVNSPVQTWVYGVGGELQLATKNAGLAVGYTPYEFLVRNFTGRFVLNAVGNRLSVYGDRQPVKDTQLSYAGLNDPGTTTAFAPGPVWGGVVASTGGVRLQLGDAAASFFVSGEAGILTGQHVQDNYRYKGALGAMFRVKSWAGGGLTVGGTLAGMHYERNEAGLSYGQGGYFSPLYFAQAAVPVKLEGRAGNFHYSLAGSAGAQRFEQAAAVFYPLDPGLQAGFIAAQGAACTPALAATYACGEYPQVVTTQFSYAANSEMSYRIAEHWYGGGFVFANNARNFNDVAGGFFLRYVFRAQHSEQAYPAGLFQVDGVRALQIP